MKPKSEWAGVINHDKSIILKRRLFQYILEHRKDRDCPFRPTAKAVEEHREALAKMEAEYKRYKKKEQLTKPTIDMQIREYIKDSLQTLRQDQ